MHCRSRRTPPTSTTSFTLRDTSSAFSVAVASFNGTDGASPYYAGVISDASGNLFGTTNAGGANGTGTVYELVNIGTVNNPVYSSTPTTLVVLLCCRRRWLQR